MSEALIKAIDDALPGAYEITSAVIRDDGTALIEVRNTFGVHTRDDFNERGLPVRKNVSKRKAYYVAQAFCAVICGGTPT